jgi:hypothetical protein
VKVAKVGLGVEAGTASDVVSEAVPGKVGFAIASAGVKAIGGS